MQDPKKSSSEKTRLQFSKPVIVLGGGDFDPVQLREFVGKDYALIAADGAADAALALGLDIRAIIGDFDSVRDRNAFGPDVAQIEIGEQLTTDFEKCLYSIDAPMFICFGMLGKRVDHTLAAFHTIARYGAQKHIVLMDQTDVTIGVVGDFSIDLPVGTRFSIYPLSRTDFKSSKGLKYPLDGLTLEVGNRIGTSNEVVSGPVDVVCDGIKLPYLVIISKTYFDDAMRAILASEVAENERQN